MAQRAFSAFPMEGLRFLRGLKRNNNREWFQKHKSIYETYVKEPMGALIESLAVDFQRFAPEMIASPKASAYRIYRDTRFSKDKSPYKTHVAAVFPRSGLAKHEGAGFYLHIDPTEVLIGGGIYMPMPEDLAAVRGHIADSPDEFFAVIESRKFRKTFGKLAGEQLSRVPRGFSTEHPAAEYLKYKQFLAAQHFPAEIATTPRLYKLIIDTFEAMLPLVRFLNEPILKNRRIKERQDAFFA
jgi:uncharacterized protein (TIGR02453 family)